MQTVILPGYSDKNRKWVDDVSSYLDIGGIIRPIYWMHWSDNNNKFNAYEKAKLLVTVLKGERVNIVAKSIGTLVASFVYQIIPDQIEKLIFCGIPINDLSPDDIETIKGCIEINNDKFLGFQNSKDLHGTFKQVQNFGNIISKDSDDHEYPYFSEFQDFLTHI